MIAFHFLLVYTTFECVQGSIILLCMHLLFNQPSATVQKYHRELLEHMAPPPPPPAVYPPPPPPPVILNNEQPTKMSLETPTERVVVSPARKVIRRVRRGSRRHRKVVAGGKDIDST